MFTLARLMLTWPNGWPSFLKEIFNIVKINRAKKTFPKNDLIIRLGDPHPHIGMPVFYSFDISNKACPVPPTFQFSEPWFPLCKTEIISTSCYRMNKVMLAGRQMLFFFCIRHKEHSWRPCFPESQVQPCASQARSLPILPNHGWFTMTLEGCVPAWFLITSFTLLMFTKHTCYVLNSFLFLKFYSYLLWLLKAYLGPRPAHSPL